MPASYAIRLLSPGAGDPGESAATHAGGQLLIDNWTDHGTTTDRSAAVPLLAGQLYDIRMEYYENAGGALAQLYWSSDNQLKEVIPTSQLHADPFAQEDAYAIGHDTVLEVAAAGVLANDVGSGLQAVLTSEPGHGTVALAADGSFVYTPVPGFVGTDTFSYRVLQGGRSSEAAVVTISVSNTAPVAESDEYLVHAGETLVADAIWGVLLNDWDNDGDTLTASLVQDVTAGTLLLRADGSFDYVPPAGYEGTVTFRYRLSDGLMNSDPADVVLTITNERPVAADDEYFIHANVTLEVEASGVLENDSDADDTAYTPRVVTGPSHGNLIRFDPDGAFVYLPDPGFVGTDTFTYVVSDGLTDSVPATVTLTVTDDRPVASSEQFLLFPGDTLSRTDLLANDVDDDGDPLTALFGTGPSHAEQFAFGPSGEFAYKPAPGFLGMDWFTYQVFDGALASMEVTVTLQVIDTPVALSDCPIRGSFHRLLG